MDGMSGTRSGDAPDDRDGSWANETLPLSIRRELLERELRKLGFRKAGAEASAHPSGSVQQQQQPQPSSHPGADSQSSDRSE